jgi:hypothetical protein
MWLKAGFLVGVALSSPACYMRPPKVSAPVESAQHVRVSVIGENCDADLDNGDVEIEPAMAVKLRIENPSDHALELTPSRLKLTSGGQSSPGEGENPIALAPGQSRVVDVHFEQVSGCDSPFELSFEDSVEVGNTPVRLASVRFND